MGFSFKICRCGTSSLLQAASAFQGHESRLDRAEGALYVHGDKPQRAEGHLCVHEGAAGEGV